MVGSAVRIRDYEFCIRGENQNNESCFNTYHHYPFGGNFVLDDGIGMVDHLLCVRNRVFLESYARCVGFAVDFQERRVGSKK